MLIYSQDEQLRMAVHGDEPKSIADPGSLLPYFAIADFGMTRGGVSSIEFVNVRKPFLIIQEPNHWLSLKQQAALREEDMAYTCSLLNFRNKQNSQEWFGEYHIGDENDNKNKKMKARMEFMEFGKENAWVEHVLKYYTKILSK